MQRNGADPLVAIFYLLTLDFFEPVQLHLKPPDLGIQVLRAGRRVGELRASLGIKQTRCLLLQLFLPHATCAVGCTPNSWLISFTALMPRIASSATSALKSPLKFFRLVSLITRPSSQQVTTLILKRCYFSTSKP